MGEARFSQRGVILDDGGLPVKGLPMRPLRHPVVPSLDAPQLGADTREVLARFVGLSEAELDQLEQSGAIHSVQPDNVSTH
jgi:crotonobetainyl-CoA:carnitine CoA-transferase CaiB-like acyl-CoA transferase